MEKSLYLTDRFDDHAVRLAALKLVLYLNKSMIRAIEPVCQHCCNIKYRDRILREKRGGIRYVKLRGFQCAHIRSVRLVEQDRELTKYGARLRHLGDLCVVLHDSDSARLEDQQSLGLRTSDDHGLARLVCHERKAGETVLEGGFVRNKRHDNPQ